MTLFCKPSSTNGRMKRQAIHTSPFPHIPFPVSLWFVPVLGVVPWCYGLRCEWGWVFSVMSSVCHAWGVHLHSWSLVRADCCSDTPHFWLQGPFSPTFSQLLWAILRDTEVAHCNPCHSAATGSWVGLRCTPVLLLTPGKLFYCFPGDFGVQGSSVKLCVSISQGHVCTGMGWGGALRDLPSQWGPLRS